MHYHSAKFILSAAQIQQFPLDQGIEIAFAGRSNAGKSSALNNLTRQKNLARTSKTPGRTQQINFFELDKTRRIADLPGYGFAQVPKPLQKQWQELITYYLEQRQSLKGLVILMDIRHAFTDLDHMLIEFALARLLPCHLLLTKADKLSRGAALNCLRKAETFVAQHKDYLTVQLFSSLKSTGHEEFVKQLNSWFEF